MCLRNVIKLIAVTSAVASLWSCGRSSLPSKTGSVIPGDNPYLGGLGYAYDSGRGVIVGTKCVKGDDLNPIATKPKAIVNGFAVDLKDVAKYAAKALIEGNESAKEFRKVQEDPKNKDRDPKFVGRSEGMINYMSDISYSKMLDAINGQVTLAVNAGGVDIGAGAAYARDNSASEYSLTRSIIVAVKAGSMAIKLKDDEMIPLTKTGEYAKLHKADAKTYCGDEFITQIDYGALFMATMTIELANQTQKEAIQGEIDANINGVFGMKGQLNLAMSKLSGKERIRFSVKQFGGDPTALGSAFGEVEYTYVNDTAEIEIAQRQALNEQMAEQRSNLEETTRQNKKVVEESEKIESAEAPASVSTIASDKSLEPKPERKIITAKSKNAILACTLSKDDLPKCFAAFNKLFDYATTTFLAQLDQDGGAGFVPTAYHTAKYVNFTDPFGQKKISGPSQTTLDANRRTIYEQSVEIKKDLERISNIRAYFGSADLSPATEDILNKFEQEGLNKLSMISSAMDKCFSDDSSVLNMTVACHDAVIGREEPVGTGLTPYSLVNRLAKMPYNRAALYALPTSLAVWCENYYQGLLSNNAHTTMTSIIRSYGSNFKMPILSDANTTAVPPAGSCRKFSELFQSEVHVILDGISNLEPFRNLSELETLEIGVTDSVGLFTPLQALTELTTLRIKGKMSSVDGIQGIPMLQSLRLIDTAVKDLGVLSTMPYLMEIISDDGDIENLEGLANSRSLEKLNILNNKGSILGWSLLDLKHAPSLNEIRIHQTVPFFNSEHKVYKPNWLRQLVPTTVSVSKKQVIDFCKASPKVKSCQARNEIYRR